MASLDQSHISRFFPGLMALKQYDRSWLQHDLAAGLSVAAVAIPVAIAYSQLAGLPPVYGLYASILPLLAYAVFGTSRQLIMAPDAATCAIIAAVVVPMAGADPSRQVSLTMVLTILAGVFCIIAGTVRLGFITSFLARPILAGYLNGIAISIISGQLGKLFGFELKPTGFFRQFLGFLARLGDTHGPTLAVGVAAFLALRLLRHLLPQLPAPLIVALLGIGASRLLRLGERGVALVGTVPAGLPMPFLPSVSMDELHQLAMGAVGLALISFNSAMVTARSFAVKNRYEIDSNQEFIALGFADIGSGLFQGFAVSGADSRTAVNDSVGGKSQVTGLVAAGLIVLVLLFGTVPLAALPVAVLAAVLINSAIGLFDLEGLAALRRFSLSEFRLSILALLGVISVGVLPGVIVAVGAAIVMLLAKAASPPDAVLGKDPGTGTFRDISLHPEATTLPGMVIFRFDAPLLFFNADHFKSRVRTVLEKAGPGVHTFLIDAETMLGVDSTGTACIAEVHEELRAKGVSLVFAGAHANLRDGLRKSGLMEKLGPGGIHPALTTAIARLEGAGR